MASRKIEVAIVGDSRSLERTFARAGKSAQKFSVGLGTIAKGALVFEGVGRAVNLAADAVRSGASEWSEQAKVTAQTNAVLKSTQGIANVTAKGVDSLSDSIQRYSGIDDEAIQKGENLLLTFKNVRNEVGKGNSVFDRATKAAVDLSVAGFGSLESNSIRLGKALNDPVRGMTALGRAGITFSDSQKETIKQLVESNRVLEAQKIILREVESQVGGSARAFGQTLPGQLSRLRETARNVFGDFVGFVTPALTGALDVVNQFFDELAEARTIRAKLNVVFSTVTGVAESLQERIGKAVSQIDFNAVFARARGIADGLQRRLEEVDFSIVGERIGQAFVDAVKVAVPAAKDMAERVNEAVRAIDFEDLGKKLGPGLAAAIVTAFVTLADPAFWVRNWDLALAVAATVFRARIAGLAAKLLAPLGRLGGTMVLGIVSGIERVSPLIARAVLAALIAIPRIVLRVLSPLTSRVARLFGRLGRIARFTVTVLGIQAAINAVIGFASRVGSVFKNLGASIAGAFNRAWDFIKQRALRAALEIIEPFTHIPGFLGGGVFQDLKAKWQQTLADMESNTKSTTRTIQSAIDSIEGKTVEVEVITRLKTIVETATTVGGETRPPTGNVRDARVASSAAVAKAEANRAAAVAADQKAAAEKAAAARKAAARAAARAAAAAKKAQEQAIEAFGVLMESFALKLDVAGATKGFADDLRVLREQEKAIKAEIAVEGRTTELERQLFDIRQQRADIRRQIAEQRRTQRQERQFEALGLTSTGDQRIPGVGALSKRLQSVKAAVKGTFLDTQKTRTEFARIAKVLAEGPKKVGRDVRAAILQMLNDISGALDSGGKKGPLTKFQKRGVGDFLKNVTGLTPEQIKQLRQNFSQFGAGDVPQNVRLAVAGGGGIDPRSQQAITIEQHIFLDGKELMFSSERHREKRKSRTSGSRRGTRAGRM